VPPFVAAEYMKQSEGERERDNDDYDAHPVQKAQYLPIPKTIVY
jgi:hypothetical protein